MITVGYEFLSGWLCEKKVSLSAIALDREGYLSSPETADEQGQDEPCGISPIGWPDAGGDREQSIAGDRISGFLLVELHAQGFLQGAL